MISNLDKERKELLAKLPAQGEDVVLTFSNNGSPVKTGPLGHIEPDTYEVRGKVSAMPHWDRDPDHFAVVVPNSPVRLRIIDIHRVLSINGEPLFHRKGKSPRLSKQTFVISASKGGNSYTVTFENGQWKCTCAGYNFRRNCRHVTEAKTKLEQEHKDAEE